MPKPKRQPLVNRENSSVSKSVAWDHDTQTVRRAADTYLAARLRGESSAAEAAKKNFVDKKKAYQERWAGNQAALDHLDRHLPTIPGT